MRAAVIDTLQSKGAFELKQAVALAEAMDLNSEAAQYVTVAILDARVDILKANVDAKIDKLEWRINLKLLWLGLTMIAAQVANGPWGSAVVDAIKRAL